MLGLCSKLITTDNPSNPSDGQIGGGAGMYDANMQTIRFTRLRVNNVSVSIARDIGSTAANSTEQICQSGNASPLSEQEFRRIAPEVYKALGEDPLVLKAAHTNTNTGNLYYFSNKMAGAKNGFYRDSGLPWITITPEDSTSTPSGSSYSAYGKPMDLACKGE